MNDFTKEELKSILERILWWSDGDDSLYSEKLVNKIQALIDNYCECDHSNLDTNICYKCGVGVLK